MKRGASHTMEKRDRVEYVPEIADVCNRNETSEKALI